MNIQQIPTLRIVIGLLALGALTAQIFVIPSTAMSYASAFPEAVYLAIPYAVAFIVAVVGVELALLAGWKTLSIAKQQGSLTSSAMGQIEFITASLVFTALVMLGTFAHACFFTTLGSPATLFGLLVSLGFGAGALIFRQSVKRHLDAQTHHGGLEHAFPAF